MSISTETASEFYGLAQRAADRGLVDQALHYSEKATDLLLRGEQMKPRRYYAPQNTHMSNVVKTAGCKPLYPRRRYWLRKVFVAFVTVLLFLSFVAALFIINEAING